MKCVEANRHYVILGSTSTPAAKRTNRVGKKKTATARKTSPEVEKDDDNDVSTWNAGAAAGKITISGDKNQNYQFEGGQISLAFIQRLVAAGDTLGIKGKFPSKLSNMLLDAMKSAQDADATAVSCHFSVIFFHSAVVNGFAGLFSLRFTSPGRFV